MNNWWIYGGLALLAGVGLTRLGSAESGDSQPFSPARYALVEGAVNVATVQNPGNNNVQKVLFKLDTRTGQVWVLQLAVNSAIDPTVQSAVWAPVSATGAFQAQGGQ